MTAWRDLRKGVCEVVEPRDNSLTDLRPRWQPVITLGTSFAPIMRPVISITPRYFRFDKLEREEGTELEIPPCLSTASYLRDSKAVQRSKQGHPSQDEPVPSTFYDAPFSHPILPNSSLLSLGIVTPLAAPPPLRNFLGGLVLR